MKSLLLMVMMFAATPAFAQRVEADGAVPPALSPEQIQHALRRYAHEPSVQVLLAALREIEELDPEQAHELAIRARLANLLPTLRGRARRGQGIDFAERQDDLRVSTDDSLSLEVSVSWRLDRLVYGPNEVALLREAGRRLRQREARERLLIQAYFERRRLQLERDLLAHVSLENEMRIIELAALIDALSAGAFLSE